MLPNLDRVDSGQFTVIDLLVLSQGNGPETVSKRIEVKIPLSGEQVLRQNCDWRLYIQFFGELGIFLNEAEAMFCLSAHQRLDEFGRLHLSQFVK